MKKFLASALVLSVLSAQTFAAEKVTKKITAPTKIEKVFWKKGYNAKVTYSNGGRSAVIEFEGTKIPPICYYWVKDGKWFINNGCPADVVAKLRAINQ